MVLTRAAAARLAAASESVEKTSNPPAEDLTIATKAPAENVLGEGVKKAPKGKRTKKQADPLDAEFSKFQAEIEELSSNEEKEECSSRATVDVTEPDDKKEVISAGPLLYGSTREEKQETLPAVVKEKRVKLTLSRADRARRAKILKEALLNVDQKQQEWKAFANQKKSPDKTDSPELPVSENAEGGLFGKKVAFSFKPKSASRAKKGNSPTSDRNVFEEAVLETPGLKAAPPLPALALNTPAVKAQSLAGNPVLDLRFLFPKATPPDVNTPDVQKPSIPEEASSGSGDAFQTNAGVCEGRNSDVAFTPELEPGEIFSPPSVHSASPALKEIMRAAQSFAASPSSLNFSHNPTNNQRRRESYSDVFASPTLVSIFKGVRQTVAQKADSLGPERVKSELELLTEAAKEYAASRAQLADEKTPLGILCKKETELALSFAEKLQLADPEREVASGVAVENLDEVSVSYQQGGDTSISQIGREQIVVVEAASRNAPSISPWNYPQKPGVALSLQPGYSGAVEKKAPPNRLFVIVDTNCYLSNTDMPAVRRIHEAAQSIASGQRQYEWQCADSVVIVVPDAVIRELDGLKLNPHTTGMARAALRFLKDGCRAIPRSIELAGPEKRVQVEPIRNGPPEFSGADDAILGCCLYMDRCEGEALLLTNDVALQLKAMMYGLEACSAAEFLRNNLDRPEHSTRNWAAQMRQVIAMRQPAVARPPSHPKVAAY